MGENLLQVIISTQLGALRSGMDEAVGVVRSAVAQMNSQFQTLQGIAGSVGKSIGGLIAGAFTIGALKDAISTTRQYANSVHELNEAMGMEEKQASVMNVALKLIGKTAEDYISINFRLARQVRSNEEAVNALGITTRASNGQFLEQNKIFDNAIKKMLEYKEGTDRNLFALNAFGRGAREVLDYHKLTNEVMQRAKEIANEYGLVMDEKAVESTKKYARELNTLNVILDSVKVSIGSKLIPELTKLAAFMGKNLSGAFDDIKDVIIRVIVVFTELYIILKGVVGFLEAVWSSISIIFTTLGKAASAAQAGDWNGFWNAITYGGKKAVVDFRMLSAELDAEAAKMRLGIAQLYDKTPKKKKEEEETAPPKGGKSFREPEVVPWMKKWEQELRDRMELESRYNGLSLGEEISFWRQKLLLATNGSDAQRKERMAVQGKIFDLAKRGSSEEYKIAMESAQALMESEVIPLDEKRRVADEFIALSRRMYSEDSHEVANALKERMKIEEKAAKDEYKLAVESRKAVIDSEQTGWDDKRRMSDEIVDLARKTYTQDSVEYAKAVEDRAKLEEKLVAEKVKILEGWNDKSREAQAKEIESQLTLSQEATNALRSQYQKRAELGEVSASDLIRIENELVDSQYRMESELMGRLQTLYATLPEKFQEVLEKMKMAKQKFTTEVINLDLKAAEENKRIWSSIVSPIASAVSTSINGIIQGTTTLRNALRNLFQSIFLSFVDLLVKKMINEWLLGELMKIEISKTFAAILAALTMSSAATETGIRTKNALTAITTNAAVTASEGAKSQAGVPYIGPILAVAAAASLLAMVLGFKSMVSASGGWDVDRGGMAMIHDKEMVLPANLAEGFRNVLRGGGGGGGGGGSTAIHQTVRIQAMDSQDVARALKGSGRSALAALRYSARALGAK